MHKKVGKQVDAPHYDSLKNSRVASAIRFIRRVLPGLLLALGCLSGISSSHATVSIIAVSTMGLRGKTEGKSPHSPVTSLFKSGSHKKKAKTTPEKKNGAEQYRIPPKVAFLFAKTGELLVHTADRFKLGTLLKLYGRKLLFLGVCAVVIMTAVGFYRGRYEGKRFMTTTRLSIMDKEVQRACRYIEDNYANPELSLETVSKVLVTGEAFLEALFEKELGLTLEGFINQVRINRVKIMLRHSPGIDVRELARATGYRDTSDMLPAFETICGCDIAAYRQSLSNCDNG